MCESRLDQVNTAYPSSCIVLKMPTFFQAYLEIGKQQARFVFELPSPVIQQGSTVGYTSVKSKRVHIVQLTHMSLFTLSSSRNNIRRTPVRPGLAHTKDNDIATVAVYNTKRRSTKF